MKKQVLSFVFILSSALLAAQLTDPVIMKVNGKDVKKSEFEYIYKKNNNEDAIEKKSLDEYIVLFKNFKLKVAEAEAQGLDTTANFKSELNDYRAQLAKPYLSDIQLNEALIRKEYDRMKENVEISHILITFTDKNADKQETSNYKVFPADTLAAYKKAIQIQKRLLKGEDFGTLAKDVSNDTQSLQQDQPGYLGWFTGLTLTPSLEDAAFSTPVGQVSIPVRSHYGYHIVKVLNRKADPGLIRAAHILVVCPKNADTVQVSDAKIKVDEIYAQVLHGEDFGELAKKYSNDNTSAENGGDLTWFGFGQMVKEFQDAAFSLKEVGEVAPPVRTRYGFHIIKLLDKKPIPSLDEKRSEIIKKLERNGSYMELNQPGMEKLKQENGFSLNEKAYKELQQATLTMYPVDSVFIDTFSHNENMLFIANDTPYTIAQFISYIKENKQPSLALSTDLLNECLNGFEVTCLIKEENRLLENKYPEFKSLMQEYRDGTLLFEISNREVWDKASRDSDGLKAFFEQHKADYAWKQPHYKGYVVLCKDAKTKKKMLKEINKMVPDSAAQYLLEKYKVGEVSYVKIEKGLFVQGENAFVDETVFKNGKAKCPTDYSDFFVIGKLLSTTPDDYNDVRGLVITDYQNYLENMWVDSLAKKYPVIIYPEIVNSIK